ncbi:MAG: hypothetical protein HC886_20565 [Leptolyngbyaceae cyanobacterium SM1_1_3]|nr:hypothetical protein [Leptolyngbyaceae cyanobacterium SM1_1_3]NJN03557.1 hypothetical protein [Leptolyngbyaceae cyanobacterium RM1_1_2]NJO12012.1 hypothetical protein [Leptolyngbyaceae cyanobacterium SL_1_1]
MLKKSTYLAAAIALVTPIVSGISPVKAQPTTGTVQSLTSGDRACYVEIADDSGAIFTRFADFEICEQDLVGQRVEFTYETASIIAESCQGNPECSESEQVMLITQAEVISEPMPNPAPSAMAPMQSLADGNYRYWNGTASSAIVSNQTLLAQGGVLFLFRKQGNAITGTFSYIDGQSICLQGQVNGNTVTGTALQRGDAGADPISVISSGETFTSFGPSGLLQVRRGRELTSETIRYNSAILNLGSLNRINAGSVLPPGGC